MQQRYKIGPHEIKFCRYLYNKYPPILFRLKPWIVFASIVIIRFDKKSQLLGLQIQKSDRIIARHDIVKIADIGE